MKDPYFQNLFAERIGGANYGKGTAIYKFEKIKRAKRAVLSDFPHRKLLDFGIGENDEMADDAVRQALKLEVDKPECRGYADNGIQEYKEAAARWLNREFDISLIPEKQINHCIGSKSALAMIPGLFINPGDITIMTSPGYPIAGTYTKYYGGEVYYLPLKSENSFLPDLSKIPEEVCNRAKLLVLNYPNSPTGALASVKFYESVFNFALKKNLVVVNDAAHIMLTYGKPPLSMLQVDGAMDVGIEIHSMSKGFNMIGWRLGFVAGNEHIVRAFADLKDNTDSGQFIAIQRAGCLALDNSSIPQLIRQKYERRLKKLVAVLTQLGFQAEMPGGTYFLYVPAPKGVFNGSTFSTAEDASQFLIRERSICTVPWDDAGRFLRFSVTYIANDEAEEDTLMESLKSRLENDKFIW